MDHQVVAKECKDMGVHHKEDMEVPHKGDMEEAVWVVEGEDMADIHSTDNMAATT